MSVNQEILETSTHEIPLEDISDDLVTQERLEALEQRNVVVTEGKVRTAGSKIKYTHLEPENPTDEVGIVIANGYWAPKSAYAPLVAELALRGRRVTHICPPRTQSFIASVQPEQLKDVLLLQAQALWAVMKVMGEDKYDLYGHSMGTPIVSRVVGEKHDRVRSLLLAGGAGLNGRNSVVGMLIKSGGVVKHDILSNRRDLQKYNSPRVLVDTLYHGLRRPDRTIREGITVAREDVRPRLEKAKEAEVAIGALLFGSDIYFSTQSVLKSNGDLFDALHVAEGAGHVHPQDHPIDHSRDTVAVAEQLAIGNLKLTA